MATFQAVKKAVTLTPSVRTLPSGIPYGPLLNLAVRAPHDAHSHGHSEPGIRSDVAPRWAGGVSRTSSGLVSKTFTTGQSSFTRLPVSRFSHFSHHYSYPFQLSTPSYPHLRCRERRPRLLCIPHQSGEQSRPFLLYGRFHGCHLCVCRQVHRVRVLAEHGCLRRCPRSRKG